MTSSVKLPEALHLRDVSHFLSEGQPQHAGEQEQKDKNLHSATLATAAGDSSSPSLTPQASVMDNSDPPSHAVTALPRWNQSANSIFRTMSTFFGFVIMGANDAVYGAIIPYLQTYYDISYTVVSLVFLSPMVGYISAAVLNNLLHKTFGRRGVAIIGPSAHIIAYIVISCHPPYPVLVVVFVLAGFGNGVLDAAWNAWLGNLANPNELLGFLHGFYGVGATIAPLVATAMITRAGMQWYTFYYIMIGGACIELASATWAFWHETSARFRASMSAEALNGATRKAVKTRVAWVSSIFLLIYVGIEVALGGWIVNFMIEVRKGGEFESGLVATGFWLGITLGRVVLGFVTPRIGENLAICVYLMLAVGLQLLFWLIPSFAVSSIAVALVGFMLGPLFPAVVVAATKLLPVQLHVATIGFAAAFGGSGACVFPFAIGAIAQSAGLIVLQPIILAMLVSAAILWGFGMPGISGEKVTGVQKKLNTARQSAKRIFYGCIAARL